MKYKVGLVIVLVFAVMQFFVAEKIPFEESTIDDFIAMEKPNEQVELMLKTICYDCHSNQITYPWYSKIAPVSWFLNDHIKDGMKHLNFSNWGEYAAAKKAHKAEEGWEEVEKQEMPLASYTYMHRDADLSDEERALLVAFFKGVERKYSN